jgi:hypothetical protein
MSSFETPLTQEPFFKILNSIYQNINCPLNSLELLFEE